MDRLRLMRGLLLLIACSLGGCVYSVHPLDESKNGVLESALPGAWVTQADDGKQLSSMSIRATKQPEYEVDLADADSRRNYRYEAILVRLDKSLFADLLFDGEVKADGSIQDLPSGAIATHIFLRVSVDGDTLEISILNYDWLRTQFIEKKTALAHEELDMFTTLLTAPTPQLQDFLRKAATVSEAFDGPIVFTREK
jgi:hypothetical protein